MVDGAVKSFLHHEISPPGPSSHYLEREMGFTVLLNPPPSVDPRWESSPNKTHLPHFGANLFVFEPFQMCRGPQLLYHCRTYNDVSAVWCSQNVSRTETALQPTLLGPANPYKPPFFIAFSRLLPQSSLQSPSPWRTSVFQRTALLKTTGHTWHVLELQAGCCFCLTRFRLLFFFQKEKSHK